ncbi:hypothetical protein HDU99_003342 [Rhizoclosmatium hyalinum]|nr:hypothetical protein HDU99_003342 [Rhizoclosmatium hyalinum]
MHSFMHGVKPVGLLGSLLAARSTVGGAGVRGGFLLQRQQQQRPMSKLASLVGSSGSLAITPPGTSVVYTGAIGKAIQALKRVSVISLSATWATTPLFAFTSVAEGGASTAAIAVMVGALIVSSGSTALIAWCCKPYVVSIAGAGSQLTLTRLSFFGVPYATTVDESELRTSRGRMFSTWEAKGELFYVLADGSEGRMKEIVDGVLKREVGLASPSLSSHSNSAEKKENWDDVVKRLREKKD